MKARVSMLAVSLALGVAIAQTTPSNPPTQDPQDKATQAGSKANTQTDAKTSTNPAEVKTTWFKGVLVDMSCASHAGSTAATPAPASAASSDSANSANRAASDSGSSCPVSASSTEIGMKLEDGRTVRFDLVGNQRAQDALKNDKSWSKDLSANKAIHAKVSGVLNGDKLIVADIH
jgi:hypothetical protein